MAQLVARLVRNEKVGGSNPPSSTTDRHPIVDVGFSYVRAWYRPGGYRTLRVAGRVTFRCVGAGKSGYRTKRVGFMVTFPLFGAEKSVLKLVGTNLKDGQNVLVL